MPRSDLSAAAVLLSGGLDSAVLCVEMLGRHSQVAPLYVRSGLRWEPAELAALRRFLDAVRQPGLGELVVLDEPIADVYGEHWSTGGQNVPGAETADEAVYLPGRNLLLTTKAAVWCVLREIDVLALGSLGSNPFPDSTPDFFERLQGLLNQALGRPLELVRPFGHAHKSEVVHLGRDLPLHLTFSCIDPVEDRHCGVCNKCAERKQGFEDAGVVDRTVYAR